MYREIMRNRKDAERYRRLRQKLYSGESFDIGEATLRMKVIGQPPSEAEFDTAIDNLKTNHK